MTVSLSDAARSWVGTRFAHQGRRKCSAINAGGVDCLGLLVGVASECNIQFDGLSAAQLDETDYGHYPDERRLMTALSAHLTSQKSEPIQVNDVVLMEIDGRMQHLGIVGEKAGVLTLIHAYASAKKVVEHGLDEVWRARVKKQFRLS